MSATQYPSVTIVAGPIQPARNPVGAFGHMLRMHDAGAYITITPEVAAQWVSVLEPIASTITNETSN